MCSDLLNLLSEGKINLASQKSKEDLMFSIENLCWRAACKSISSILMGQNVIIPFLHGMNIVVKLVWQGFERGVIDTLRACQVLDIENSGMLTGSDLMAVLVGICGMSHLQVTIILIF